MNSTKVVAMLGLVMMSVILIGVVDGGRCKYIPHCDDCTYDATTRKATCFKCDKLFGLTTENGFSKCLNCSENNPGCLLCKDFTVCDMCRFRARDGPDMNGRATCSACADNCKSCEKSGSGKCDICKVGSRKVGDKCQSCDVEHCSYCDSTFAKCSSCMSGYYLQDNTCTECTPSCSLCKTATTCSICKTKFFLDETSGKCVACTDNCNECHDYGQCTTCDMGFFLENKKCSACDDSCLVCNSKNDCTYCRQGKPVDGNCRCAPNCSSCGNSGYGKCDSCDPGYTQSEGKRCKKVAGDTLT